MIPEHLRSLRERRILMLDRHMPGGRLLGDGIDRAGFVVAHDDRIYRFVRRRHAKWIRCLLSGRGVARAVDAGLLAAAEEVGQPALPGHMTLAHDPVDRLPSPTSARDLDVRAARLRQLLLHLLEDGAVVVDLHPKNFGGPATRPLWLDWGAIRPAVEVPPTQLERHFVHWYRRPGAGDVAAVVRRRHADDLPNPQEEPSLRTIEGWLRRLARVARPLPKPVHRFLQRAWHPALHWVATGRHERHRRWVEEGAVAASTGSGTEPIHTGAAP